MRKAVPLQQIQRLVTVKEILPAKPALDSLLINRDPQLALQTGKLMARAWAKSLRDDIDHLNYARTFIYHVISTYRSELGYDSVLSTLPELPAEVKLKKLDESLFSLASALGVAASKLELADAAYQLGNIYTAVLPESFRSGNGIFYTPPALTNRLLNMVQSTGVDWSTARVIDPACGGGAFLAPIAMRIVKALKGYNPEAILSHLETHLTGCDIDPFGAWLTQVLLECSLSDVIAAAGRRIGILTIIGDSLELDSLYGQYDAVIGNPPYGKLKLKPELREKYERGLYGHANLYGLFTDLALRLVSANGTIGYLTPTSFLSGEYFKKLRLLLRQECTPVEIDFVSFRKGVFEDVLQETMLATYNKKVTKTHVIKVNQIVTGELNTLKINAIGKFKLHGGANEPWILARTPQQASLVKIMNKLSAKLSDWGYRVSTGPLVWNRHKKQLQKKPGVNVYPIIWAESITPDGRFVYKTERKNHAPNFKFKSGDEWLIIKESCILLQRTTAKEQHKRLIAAALPEEFINKKGGVIVENHLNMIVPIAGQMPKVSTAVLSAFLNSRVVNDAFRCVSGSVAVSAYELESLPLPKYNDLECLQKIISESGTQEQIENECKRIYL